MIASWQESYDKPRQCVEKQRCYSADKGQDIHAYVFPVVMDGCKSWTEEGRMPKYLMPLNCGAGEDS